jgi:hypothetical protein
MKKSYSRFFRLFLLCVLATAANSILNNFCAYVLKIPLYFDTVFTAAVCFTAGFIPGIATALLTNTVLAVRDGGFQPFVLCAIAEVLIINWLKPQSKDNYVLNPASLMSKENALVSLVSVFARLMLLYIVCCLAVSVLGGLIDFFYHYVLSNPKQYFSAEDAFKIGIMQNGTPILLIDILSRIPTNIVERFIVIFGSYFISRGAIKLLKLSDPHYKT